MIKEIIDTHNTQCYSDYMSYEVNDADMIEELNMKFQHKKAKKLVDQSPYKRAWIAEQMGIKPQTLSAALTGSARIGVDTIGKLAKVLKVRLSELYD